MKTNSLHITTEISAIISSIDEFKGTRRVLGNLAPEPANFTEENSTIESIGSSTRIGRKLTDQQI